MDILKSKDPYVNVALNALQPDPNQKGLDGTVRDIALGEQKWYGGHFNNNDNAIRFIQVFFKPASEVTLGTTPPDYSFSLPANTTATPYPFIFDNPFRCTRGLSMACTTTETGTTGATAKCTGGIYLAKVN